MNLSPLGDAALLLVLGEGFNPAVAARVRAVASALARARPEGVTDVVVAFASIAIHFEPARIVSIEWLQARLTELAAAASDADEAALSRTIELPTCYGGIHGPDLATVANHAGLPEAEVIARHAAGEYRVNAIGFAPGFPYLEGLPPELATPRRGVPRVSVPAGSVGIGGAQTGVYPVATPGGWNLIGRTPVALFDPARPEPALLRVGDRVTFRALPAAECLPAAEAGRTGKPTQPGRREGAREPVAHLKIGKPGMFTTVQDAGRRGYRAAGVPSGGAADPFALKVANLLVGNSEGAAALEFTLVGPEISFSHDTLVAVTGGQFAGVPGWRPFVVSAGTKLELGPAETGCRGYLAVAGGIVVEPVLESCSTEVRAGFGGYRGRTLRAGDEIAVAIQRRSVRERWRIDPRILPAYSSSPVLRVLSGVHAARFAADWFQTLFEISAHSDRMGVRLEGKITAHGPAPELFSLPTAPGTVQVPPNGEPIVLLADAQTIGGYPHVAHVFSVDLPLLAQLRPGDSLRFRPAPLAAAQQLLAAQERALSLLREGLTHKLA